MQSYIVITNYATQHCNYITVTLHYATLPFFTAYHTYVALLFIYLAVMTYNQVHYFRVNHLADFTQNGQIKIPVG